MRGDLHAAPAPAEESHGVPIDAKQFRLDRVGLAFSPTVGFEFQRIYSE
jgi:hypothetical protein